MLINRKILVQIIDKNILTRSVLLANFSKLILESYAFF